MIESDQTTQFKFRYVFDVYIYGATGAIRFKTPPNPEGKGLIDVSALAAAQIEIPENLPFLSDLPFYMGDYLATKVYILAGEEFATTALGAPVIYDGLGNVGEPAYGLYADSNFRPCPNSTTPVAAWAAAQSPEEYFTYIASGGEDILLYEMALLQIADTGGRFLTSAPTGGFAGLYYNPQTIRSDEDFTLTWMNRNFEAGTGPQDFAYSMVAQFFNNTSFVDTKTYFNTVANGGLWPLCSDAPYSATGASGPENYLESFKINPAGVTGVAGAFDQITLTLLPYDTYGICATPGVDDGVSQVITLNIDDGNCWGFQPIRFTWLNPLGGRDWYTFMKRNTFVQQASRSTLYKLPGYWSAAAYSVYDNQPARYGTTVFRNDLANSWTASTDWLTEQESAWLREMFASPSVFAYLPDRTQPVGIIIQDAEYTVQTIRRENLFQYFVSFVESLPGNTQGY
jgi:hypothetical protein